MKERLRFILNRIAERLWVRPLVMAFVSIGLVFLARLADSLALSDLVPDVSSGTIESLLTIIASSMLVIATFSVASMVSAYASASSTASPRAFTLLVADDTSQNALSTFIGAFIFSIVALSVLKNSYYDIVGRFVLFSMTLIFFFIVIITFVRWVDRVARLGRMETTIKNVERATTQVFERLEEEPHFGGIPLRELPENKVEVISETVGYVQQVDMAALQKYAESAKVRIAIAALPGSFVAPNRPLAFITSDLGDLERIEKDEIVPAFRIGDSRTFDDDPRFGLIVLSEIASRALSPGVNDPGTAIDVVGRMVRLFVTWNKPLKEKESSPVKYDRVEVPELRLDDMLEDAFRPIARDGADTIEVVIRLLKALQTISETGDAETRVVAQKHARLATGRAEEALSAKEDIELVKHTGKFAYSS